MFTQIANAHNETHTDTTGYMNTKAVKTAGSLHLTDDFSSINPVPKTQ